MYRTVIDIIVLTLLFLDKSRDLTIAIVVVVILLSVAIIALVVYVVMLKRKIAADERGNPFQQRTPYCLMYWHNSCVSKSDTTHYSNTILKQQGVYIEELPLINRYSARDIMTLVYSANDQPRHNNVNVPIRSSFTMTLRLAAITRKLAISRCVCGLFANLR